MHALLIDNYDSFTYNLYQLISEVNGVEPTVVRNDEARTVADLDPWRFDNVVVSPGPGGTFSGRTCRPARFGGAPNCVWGQSRSRGGEHSLLCSACLP